MGTTKNSGEVKIGDEYYTWQYNEEKHLFEAWNKDKVQVAKQEMSIKDFEKLTIASLLSIVWVNKSLFNCHFRAWILDFKQ